MAPSDHRTKRQNNGNQSTITSFFSRASATQQEDPTTTAFPVQSGQIQSDLFTVGMRVRKAVAEGYKTGSYSALSIFHDTTAPTPTEPEVPTQVVDASGSRPVFRPNVRELAPFCGLNKVGGLAQQITESSGNYIFPSSQESNISVESLGAGKRRFDDDDEEEEEVASFLQGPEQWQREEEISPKSKPMGLGVRMGGRAMAVPKSRIKRMDGKDGSTNDWEQENMMDFGEADFLDYGHFGKEVEMDNV